MALTPAQIKARLATELLPKYLKVLTWPQLVAAVQNSSSAQKAELIGHLQGHAPHAAGQKLLQILSTELTVLAEAEVDTMMADGSLDLTGFDRMFGDG